MIISNYNTEVLKLNFRVIFNIGSKLKGEGAVCFAIPDVVRPLMT